MTNNTHLPLAAMRAQMAFWKRTGDLMQESRDRWLALGAHMQNLDASQALAGGRGMQQANEISQFNVSGTNTVQRFLDRSAAYSQAFALTAMNDRTAFAAGIQGVLTDWQREMANASTQTHTHLPLYGIWTNMLESMNSLQSDDGKKDGN